MSVLRSHIVLSCIAILGDFFAITLAILCAYWLRMSEMVVERYPVLFDISLQDIFFVGVVVAGCVVGVLILFGTYTVYERRKWLNTLTRVVIVISLGVICTTSVLYFQLVPPDSRFILVVAWVFSLAFVLGGRVLVWTGFSRLQRRYGFGKQNVVIFGEEPMSHRIHSALVNRYGNGINVIDVLPQIHTDWLRSMHHQHTIHQVIVVEMNNHRKEIVDLINFCEVNEIQFSYTPDLFGSLLSDMEFYIVNGISLVTIRGTLLHGWQRVLKRAFDILGALCILCVCIIPFLAIAFWIKWESKGSVFVKVVRISCGKEFHLYKFRSMINNAHLYKSHFTSLNERTDGPLFKIKDDPRITKFGTLLRKTRIDELPQVLNVLRGEMSLVGPRPHEPEEVMQYNSAHRKVFAVKPGVTGFAQVSGAQDLLFEEEIRLDRFYIEHWSFKLDMIILVKTCFILFFRHDGI